SRNIAQAERLRSAWVLDAYSFHVRVILSGGWRIGHVFDRSAAKPLGPHESAGSDPGRSPRGREGALVAVGNPAKEQGWKGCDQCPFLAHKVSKPVGASRTG